MELTLAECAARVGGDVEGDGGLRIDGVAPLDSAGPSQVSFFSNRRYRASFEASRAGAVLVDADVAVPAGRTVLRTRNAYLAFAKLMGLFHPPREVLPGIAAQAAIHPTARVHPTAQVMPLASVGAGAEVGARTVLHPGVHLGVEARVGVDCVLFPNVIVRDRCVVGDRVALQPGCVLGSDGFGYAFDAEGEGAGPRHYKLPQLGVVVVEDDVELGANTVVDRATFGATRIGRGTKIDNLVQIAHNVAIGPLSVIVSQVGISGSSTLGTGVVVGGQVGIVGHVTVGDGVRIAARAGVAKDVAPGEAVGGTPARAHVRWLRNAAALDRLADVRKELRELRKAVRRLERQAGS